jgi:hypothetical protein
MEMPRWIRTVLLPIVGGLVLAGGMLLSAGTATATTAPGQLATPAEPDGNKACLECHSQDHSMVRDGQQISVHVDPTTFNQSVHGVLSCVRCHGEVGPEHAKDPSKPLGLPTGRELKVQMSQLCTKCHAGVYEESYKASFHGIAVAHGDSRAATCVDCHGSHGIQPARNPQSTVAKANVAQTCSTTGCHANAPANFAEGTEHFVASKPETAGGLYWIYKGFMALIVFDTMKDGPIVMFELLRRLKG